MWRFQLTRSRGARLYIFDDDFAELLFQLTRSRGARRENSKPYLAAENFNSRAHVERDELFGLTHLIRMYFNSRAHVERDANRNITRECTWISTHALTWSATKSKQPRF